MIPHVFLHLIADYGTGDAAFGEVVQKLYSLHPSLTVHCTSVPAFSTLATGFCAAQYALVNPVAGMVVYTNTAPRRDDGRSRVENEGEGLCCAALANGVIVVGVNAGYCFSFLKRRIASFHAVNVPNRGSQFRSRDFYPEAVIGIARGQREWLGASLNPAEIPDVPPNRIAWVDGYGNMKTTLRRSACSLAPGQRLTIAIGAHRRTAVAADGAFGVREGELAFAPGSSGGEDPFMEIFLRGGCAWAAFGKPAVESAFTLGEGAGQRTEVK